VSLRIKRVYDAPTLGDGYRVLVDRLWPRGLTKERAHLDGWLKEVAPSTDLRVWWNHDPARFEAFAERYRSELARNPAVHELEVGLTLHRTVTLVYGARDTRINHATVLAQFVVNSAQADSADE
jgi:uncharacterized protein YeaO (DUF488 family)